MVLTEQKARSQKDGEFFLQPEVLVLGPILVEPPQPHYPRLGLRHLIDLLTDLHLLQDFCPTLPGNQLQKDQILVR